MNVQNSLNIVGLVINMIGAYTMYHFTPKIQSTLYLYQAEEYKKMQQKDAHKNKLVRIGMLLLLVGFIFQFIALFITN